jgi:transposase
MTGKDIFMMSQKERKKLHVVRKVIEKEMSQVEAALAVELSPRQIKRLVKRIKREGDRGICHKSRGKRSNRRRDEKTKERVLELCRERYRGFGPTLATEKLLERDRIGLSDETLRLWLKEAKISYKERKKRPHRQWRERRAHVGSLIQLDGSHHDWFEGRGPKCVLMAYIDDATGRPYGRFYEYEGTFPAMDSFKRYVKQNGLPMAIYADKHTTYKSPSEPTVEEQLEGMEPMSQFERSLFELGVEMIHAHSPQAKGRIERLFGVFQDRVVKEMRLQSISGIEEGNRFLETYLPKYIEKFAIEPREPADLHRPVPTESELNQALCLKTSRVLRNDLTIAYHNKLYQIKEKTRAKKVRVEERWDGTLHISHQGKLLSYEEIKSLPVQLNKTHKFTIKIKKKTKPSLTNPFNQISREKRAKGLANTIT